MNTGGSRTRAPASWLLLRPGVRKIVFIIHASHVMPACVPRRRLQYMMPPTSRELLSIIIFTSATVCTLVRRPVALPLLSSSLKALRTACMRSAPEHVWRRRSSSLPTFCAAVRSRPSSTLAWLSYAASMEALSVRPLSMGI